MSDRTVVDLWETPLVFVNDIAYCRSFGGRLVRVFRNQTRRNGSKFGYMIIDEESHEILKFCRACSFVNVKKAVILN